MKRFRRFLIIILAFFLVSCSGLLSYAENSLKSKLDNVINSSDISKTAVVSVSIRDACTGNIVYDRDGNLLLHPASTLKAFTTPVILETLGKDSEIKTGLYKYKDNIYLKLSGDPLLTSQDLSELIKTAKSKQGHIIIDDTAIDNIPWGVGWMWDDENNPLMPKFSAYNLDHNLIWIKIAPCGKNARPVISVNYPVKVINNAVTGDKNELTVERKPWINPDTVYIDGTVSYQNERGIPVGTPEKYFTYQLKQALKTNGIRLKGKIPKGEIPSQSVLAGEISHKLTDEISNINKNSDNMAVETLFKLAGGKYTNSTGTTEEGLKAFNEFYSKLGTDTSKLVIVDASGVSHNDLIQTNWMTLTLSKLYNQPDFDIYINTLAVPGQTGTLNHRLNDLSGKLWAKTGTNAGISGITGYIKINSGKIYSFAVLIQNFKGVSSTAKKLEDEIITAVLTN